MTLTVTNNKELKELAEYLLKKYFNNIPLIPIKFCPKAKFKETELGRMVMCENDNYTEENDELLNEPEYKGDNIELVKGVYYYENTEPSWSDPLNNPKIIIQINNICKNDMLLLFGVLLHELCHYYCWYVGYDFRDGTKDFEEILHKMDLPSNSEHKYNHKKHKWEDDSDYTKIKKYYTDYRLYKLSKQA